jgi:SagB-type dehydrogenase family enzyme
MPRARARWAELDRATYPELRDRVLRYGEGLGGESHPEPRAYPGYPRWLLDRVRPRRLVALDGVLARRRCERVLETQLPPRKAVSRILLFAHGVHADRFRGPVPSSGGLQAVELYMVAFGGSWLPAGAYHYDRAGHHLSQISDGAERTDWERRVPSLAFIDGGALLWVVVGEGERMQEKYGERGCRFLLLEAGHLMQNICVLSASLGLSTVPLGGCLEPEIASALGLPPGDVVLYAGVCGAVETARQRACAVSGQH